MMGFLPELGQYVAIRVSSGLSEEEYDSRIQAVKENSLWIDPPLALKTKRLVRLPRGTKLALTYQDPADQVPFSFETMVVVGDENCLVLERPTQIIRLQRRHFVRVPLNLPVNILRVDPNTRTFGNVSAWVDNLSGGGMLVQLEKGREMYVGDIAGLNFQLPGSEGSSTISAKVRVIHKRTALQSSEPISVGIEFIDLPETEREAIIKCVFRRQLELKRA